MYLLVEQAIYNKQFSSLNKRFTTSDLRNKQFNYYVYRTAIVE